VFVTRSSIFRVKGQDLGSIPLSQCHPSTTDNDGETSSSGLDCLCWTCGSVPQR